MPKPQAFAAQMEGEPELGAARAVSPSIFRFASVLFLLSGATALAYETIWFKRFSQVWGNSALAAGGVVGAFLCGLGLGAYCIARYSNRIRSPLLWYGLAEIAIAVMALALPFAIGRLIPLAPVLYHLSAGNSLALSMLRSLTTFVLLGPPAFLMGGTLPLLILAFTVSSAARDRYTAWFYAINTLGAAAGCYLVGFHLLPSIGFAWSNLVAVALDLLIGAAAVLIGMRWMAPPPAPVAILAAAPSGPPAIPDPALRRQAILLAAALAGCASLILQMTWMRQLALMLGGSVYAFSAMLFTFLVGIGLGSLVFDLVLEMSFATIPGAVWLTLALAASVAACERAIPSLTYMVGALMPLRASQALNGVISVGASVALELLPTLGMGLLFPVFVALAGVSAASTVGVVGDIYASNTIGAIVGALATPIVIIPHWGAANAVVLAVGLYAAIVIVLIVSASQRRNLFSLLAPVAVAAALVWVSKVDFDPLVVSMGMYMYGYIPTEARAATKQLYFREGATSDVLVTLDSASGKRALRVNGKVDASDDLDMTTQLGMAYAPRFLRPTARDVLVIGFGSGTTSGASLLFPDTRVLCCDIEPAVVAASSQFSAVNHSPERSHRFSVTYDDARSFLQGTDRNFDLILSEPSNPWIAGVSNLYTTECYQAVRRRLKRGGMLAQWVQTYSLTPPDYAMIVRTLIGVFPHVALWRVPDSSDTVLLASDEPISPARSALAAGQLLVNSIPAVRADLNHWFGGSEVFSFLFANLVLDENGLRRLAANDPSQATNSDLSLRLEFDAPRALFGQNVAQEVMKSIYEAADPAHYREEFKAWGGSGSQAGLFDSLAADFHTAGLPEQAAKLPDLGLAEDPQNPDLLEARIMFSSVDDAFLDKALPVIVAGPAKRANSLAQNLWQMKRYDQAAKVFQHVAAAHPNSPTAWTNLATAYAGMNDRRDAEDAFKKALSLDPHNEDVNDSYQSFLHGTGGN